MYQGSGYGSTRAKDTPALEVVDLRSDTVTLPTAAMRRAMAEAKVGDDVYGEDPTVTELEFYVQQILEKEAALYFPSSTMSNLAASMAHCHAGNMNEVIIGSLSHQAMYEVGNLATLGRIFPQMVETNDDGTMDLARLQRALKPLDVHCTTPRLICLENTHCFLGGRVLPLKFIEGVRRVADDTVAPTRGYQVAMHLDGARLWNEASRRRRRCRVACGSQPLAASARGPRERPPTVGGSWSGRRHPRAAVRIEHVPVPCGAARRCTRARGRVFRRILRQRGLADLHDGRGHAPDGAELEHRVRREIRLGYGGRHKGVSESAAIGEAENTLTNRKSCRFAFPSS
jgi:hypothetical protein